MQIELVGKQGQVNVAEMKLSTGPAQYRRGFHSEQNGPHLIIQEECNGHRLPGKNRD